MVFHNMLNLNICDDNLIGNDIIRYATVNLFVDFPYDMQSVFPLSYAFSIVPESCNISLPNRFFHCSNQKISVSIRSEQFIKFSELY